MVLINHNDVKQSLLSQFLQIEVPINEHLDTNFRLYKSELIEAVTRHAKIFPEDRLNDITSLVFIEHNFIETNMDRLRLGMACFTNDKSEILVQWPQPDCEAHCKWLIDSQSKESKWETWMKEYFFLVPLYHRCETLDKHSLEYRKLHNFLWFLHPIPSDTLSDAFSILQL